MDSEERRHELAQWNLNNEIRQAARESEPKPHPKKFLAIEYEVRQETWGHGTKEPIVKPVLISDTLEELQERCWHLYTTRLKWNAEKTGASVATDDDNKGWVSRYIRLYEVNYE